MRKKTFLALGTLNLVVAGAFLVNYILLGNVASSVQRMVVLYRVQSGLPTVAYAAAQLFSTRDIRFAGDIRREMVTMDSLLTSLPETDRSEIVQVFGYLRQEVDSLLAGLPQEIPSNVEFQKRYSRFTQNSHSVIQSIQQAIQKEIQSLDRHIQVQRTLAFLLMLVALLATLLLPFLMARWILQPLEDLSQALHRIGLGDLKTPVALPDDPDLRPIFERLDELRRNLEDAQKRLRRMHGEPRT